MLKGMMPKEKEDGEFMDSLEIEGKDKGIGVYKEHNDTPPSSYVRLCIWKKVFKCILEKSLMEMACEMNGVLVSPMHFIVNFLLISNVKKQQHLYKLHLIWISLLS